MNAGGWDEMSCECPSDTRNAWRRASVARQRVIIPLGALDSSAVTRLQPLTRATVEQGPPPCVECTFWQTRRWRALGKPRWADGIEDDWGPWGTLYVGDDERLLGLIQYGPAEFFPRSVDLPAGPPTPNAILITCAYLTDPSTPWVMQSLFLSAIGEARDKGAKTLETFGYRYPEGESAFERFMVHRTIFPADFLADFGFVTIRSEGRVELARLELGGLVPVREESFRAKAWQRVKDAVIPEPVPERP